MTKSEEDKLMAEADRDLSEAAWALNDRASTFDKHERIIDRLDTIVSGHLWGGEAEKVWRAFVAAADKAMIASNYCADCEGTGEGVAPCCSGAMCGCYGRGVTVNCPACDGRGWTW